MKLEKKSLSSQVADKLEEMILNGTYKINDKLPTEPELMEMFQVSRNSIREAIQSLVQVGLLKSKQGIGTFVVAKERLEVEFRNSLKKVKESEVEEVRNFLEEYIIVSAIKNSTEEDIKKIEIVLKNRNNLGNGPKENTEADMNFHMAIALATHNSLLIDLYKYVAKYFQEFIASKIIEKENNEIIDRLHWDLFEAIKNKNVEKAKKAISEIIKL